MKRLLIITLVMGVIMTAGVFAKGTSETREMSDYWETKTITGKVSFADLPFPEITSGGKTYELLVPPQAVYEIDVKPGDTITVEGILVDSHMSADEDKTTLRVTKAIVDGEEYEVPFGRSFKGSRAEGKDFSRNPRSGGGQGMRGRMKDGRQQY